MVKTEPSPHLLPRPVSPGPAIPPWAPRSWQLCPIIFTRWCEVEVIPSIQAFLFRWPGGKYNRASSDTLTSRMLTLERRTVSQSWTLRRQERSRIRQDTPQHPKWYCAAFVFIPVLNRFFPVIVRMSPNAGTTLKPVQSKYWNAFSTCKRMGFVLPTLHIK